VTLEDDIDPTVFGFAKMKYAAIERERRWLCAELPDIAGNSDAIYLIDDLYITNTQMRLRDARRPDGTSSWPRLARKVDVDASHRLITSIYLSPSELALFKGMPGKRLHKRRYAVKHGDQRMGIDQFSNALTGLVLVEAEFEDDASMAAFSAPDWVLREVTVDPTFSGGHLASLTDEEAMSLVVEVLSDA
jgi:CYTH domain-containing protein